MFLVQHKPGCVATDDCKRFGISDLVYRQKNCSEYVAKIKALISCSVILQMICDTAFAFVICICFHYAAQSNQTSYYIRKGIIIVFEVM